MNNSLTFASATKEEATRFSARSGLRDSVPGVRMVSRSHFLLLLSAVAVSGGVGEPVAVSVHVRDRVTSTVGSSVVLPCTFKSDYSDYTTMEITVIWKVKVFYTGSVLFNVTNRSKGGKDFVDEVHTNVNGRYKLAGDPRQKVASLEVENVTLGDSDQYFCRVEVKRQGLRAFMDESNPGVTLEIIGSPIILRVSVKAINTTQPIVQCLAEGQPFPKIIWIDPQNNKLPANSSDTSVTSGPGKYQILGELRNPMFGGTYTCVVVSDQGNSSQSIYLPSKGQVRHLLLYIIGILVGSVILVILVVILLLMQRRKKGKAEFNPTSKRAQRSLQQYSKVSMCQQQQIPSVVPCASVQDTEGSDK
ncbi:sialic acid-binding Ig-like lectin 15 isoform X1 [Amblyraja radiata]|uniref:sialic acid-binding Ig-like lectin 15 isoform X1 n=1 Tax=Amblyraja radiata TaxID=386614 RepID=UPI001403EDA5|nr:sialic acid-binding Ig-like lectin 15 isoform X1 [Amblyraja radiata]